MKIFIFCDPETGEIWYYAYDGPGEPVIIEMPPKPQEENDNEKPSTTH